MADLDELAARDAALLDALYVEDHVLAADGQSRLDEGQQATLEGWLAVRGVVSHARATGFDADPPAAGTRGSFEMLMTAARAQAAPPQRGAWARLLAWTTPLVAHPALAGAAALVVVGGAAGVLYMKGQGRVARPPAASMAPAGSSARPPALTSPGTEGELDAVLGARPPTDRPGPAAADRRPDLGEASGGAGVRPTPAIVEDRGRPARDPRAPRGNTGSGNKALPKPPGTVTLERSPASGGPGGAPRAGGIRLEEGLMNEGGADQGAVVRQPTRPPATPAPAAPVDRDSAPTGPSTSAPPPPPPPPVASRPAQIAVDDEATPAARRVQARQLTDQARAAAKAGTCATVAARSRQVAALDPAYHRDVFVRDPDIARCR